MSQRCITINQTASDTGSITNQKPRINIESAMLVIFVLKNDATNNVKVTMLK